MIVTGDLSAVGTPIAKQLLLEEGYDLGHIYNDCGLMIYESSQEEVFAGGSGCACSASCHIWSFITRDAKGNLQRIFVVATGALLSPMMMQQKETIPTIAHGVVFERVKGE